MRTRSPTLSRVSTSIRSGVHSPCCELSITSNRAPLSFCFDGRSRHRVTPSSSLFAAFDAGRLEEAESGKTAPRARRYVGRLVFELAAEGGRLRVRALELETAAGVSADLAVRPRMNSSSTIWREVPSWV